MCSSANHSLQQHGLRDQLSCQWLALTLAWSLPRLRMLLNDPAKGLTKAPEPHRVRELLLLLLKLQPAEVMLPELLRSAAGASCCCADMALGWWRRS